MLVYSDLLTVCGGEQGLESSEPATRVGAAGEMSWSTLGPCGRLSIALRVYN